MSMLIRSPKQSNEVIRKIWSQLFGIFMRKARRNGYLPLEATALLAEMSTEEWLAMETGQVPDPAQLELIAAVLGMESEQMGVAVRICRGAWEE